MEGFGFGFLGALRLPAIDLADQDFSSSTKNRQKRGREDLSPLRQLSDNCRLESESYVGRRLDAV
jgi:hypothetical protein